jgi:hypothetical protein
VSPASAGRPVESPAFFWISLKIPANLARGHAYDTCIHIAMNQKTTHMTLPLRRKAPIPPPCALPSVQRRPAPRACISAPRIMSPRRANRISQATKPYDDSRGRKSWHANAFQPHSAAQLTRKANYVAKNECSRQYWSPNDHLCRQQVILRHYSLAQSNEAQRNPSLRCRQFPPDTHPNLK